VTEKYASVMLEESAMRAIGKLLVGNKRNKVGDGDTRTGQPTSKRRRHNEACNTTRGDTIVGVMRGTCQRDIRETTAYKKKRSQVFKQK
jgi:hypothetical protein